MHVQYVTSNLRKFQEAACVLKNTQEWVLQHFPMEIEEIQGTPHEIIHHKARTAFTRLQMPLIVEDVGLSCPILGGLPGPYVKHFLDVLGPAGIARLVHQVSLQYGEDAFLHHVAEVSCHTVYIAPGVSPIYTVGTKQGKIVSFLDPSGQHAKSWNGIFLQEGQSCRFSEMSLEETCAISMRKEALKALLERYRHVCT